MKPNEINARLKFLSNDEKTSVKPSEAEFIYEFIRKKNLTKTLEIGFAYGRSASHIMSATGSPHVVIDPYQHKYGNMGIENMINLNMHSQLELKRDYSHNVLPELLRRNMKYDFIFIDGDHKFDGVFLDFYYSDLLVRKGGYILLHDTWMRSTRLVMSFIRHNRKDYRKVRVPSGNLALYRKVGIDDRNGMHFREFYTFRSILTYQANMWISSGSSNILKLYLQKFKESLKTLLKSYNEYYTGNLVKK